MAVPGATYYPGPRVVGARRRGTRQRAPRRTLDAHHALPAATLPERVEDAAGAHGEAGAGTSRDEACESVEDGAQAVEVVTRPG